MPRRDGRVEHGREGISTGKDRHRVSPMVSPPDAKRLRILTSRSGVEALQSSGGVSASQNVGGIWLDAGAL
eukprot:89886-Lingulodinium_polyedra.AAC.1